MKLYEIFQQGSKRILPWILADDYAEEVTYVFRDPTADDEQPAEYIVSFIEMDDVPSQIPERDGFSAWEIVFGVEKKDAWREDIVGTGGKEVQIFATIVDIIRDFMKRRKPDAFTFTAKEPSRRKLYHRMSQRLAKMMNGKAIRRQTGEFWVYKNET